MKIIRASEVGTYVFCQRAWWYQLQGYETTNVDELAGGDQIHAHHGRMVMVSGCVRLVAYALLLGALILFLIYLIGEFV